MRDFFNPMVPVAVHHRLRFVCLGFRKIRINLPRSLYSPRHCGEKYHLRLVRRELELTDACGYVADFLALSERSVLSDLGNVNLPAHKVGDLLPICAPACVADAFPGAGDKMRVASVKIADIQISARTVFLN